MTTLAISARSPRTRVLGIVVAAGAVALASQFALPIPGTPVPITLQPMLVVLAGLLLGPVDGAAAMILYLVAGAAGLPVFTPFGAPGLMRLLGPTGGYLLAYPVAAAVAGHFGAGRTSYATRALAAASGIVVLYIGGITQLSIMMGNFERAAAQGLLPFIAFDAVKALIAAAVAGRRRDTV